MASVLENIHAYLAGLVDADGCISLSKSKHKDSGIVYYTPCIEVAMTVRAPLDLIQNVYGGNVVTRQRVQANHRIMYSWGSRGKDTVQNFMSNIFPFLLVKKTQAQLMLQYLDEFKSRGRGTVDSNTTKQRREEYHAMMGVLNHRGEDYGRREATITKLRGIV